MISHCTTRSSIWCAMCNSRLLVMYIHQRFFFQLFDMFCLENRLLFFSLISFILRVPMSRFFRLQKVETLNFSSGVEGGSPKSRDQRLVLKDTRTFCHNGTIEVILPWCLCVENKPTLGGRCVRLMWQSLRTLKNGTCWAWGGVEKE